MKEYKVRVLYDGYSWYITIRAHKVNNVDGTLVFSGGNDPSYVKDEINAQFSPGNWLWFFNTAIGEAGQFRL